MVPCQGKAFTSSPNNSRGGCWRRDRSGCRDRGQLAQKAPTRHAKRARTRRGCVRPSKELWSRDRAHHRCLSREMQDRDDEPRRLHPVGAAGNLGMSCAEAAQAALQLRACFQFRGSNSSIRFADDRATSRERGRARPVDRSRLICRFMPRGGFCRAAGNHRDGNG
jgi:hypothetical protein